MGAPADDDGQCDPESMNCETLLFVIHDVPPEPSLHPTEDYRFISFFKSLNDLLK
jgi:hypothetical protein